MTKYLSIAKFYTIAYERSESNAGNMGSIKWEVKDLDGINADSGVYYLHTNVPTLDERTCWDTRTGRSTKKNL